MDDDEVRAFRTQVTLLVRRLRREGHAVAGLSRSATAVLAAVERAPDATPRAVGEDVRMTSSNVAAALRELDEAGLVTRRRDPDDARRTRLALTEAGAATLVGTRGERDTWLGRAVDALLDEEEQRTLLAAGALIERLATHDAVPVRA